MFPGYSPIATGPGSGLRFAQTRGRIGGSTSGGMAYPSPFFDVAHTYLPVTIKALLRWCRYYFMTNPRINTVAFKAAQYPLTDLIIEHSNRTVQERWKEYVHDHLKLRSFQVDFGLDYNVYGNGFSTVSYPFNKYLTCRRCRYTEEAGRIKDKWVHTNFVFRMTCPQCGHVGDADVKERYIKNPSEIRLTRLNPEDIEISTPNDWNGEMDYFYTIPNFIRSDVMIGKKDTVLKVPQIFVQAMRENKGVKITTGKMFHMKRPSLATTDRGWGTPMLLPVLKDAFYLQVLKKAQEAISLEHAVPLRVLFPQAAGSSSDPFTLISLSDWKEHIAQEIARWRSDCVSPETLLETKNGLIRADAVSVGTLLKNHEGGYSAVTNVWRRPVRADEQAFRVKARGLHGLLGVVSENHPFLAARSYNNGNGHKLGSPTFIKAKDLRPKDYIGYPISREVRSVSKLDLAEHTHNVVTNEWVYVDHTRNGVPEIFEFIQNGGVDAYAYARDNGWERNKVKIAQIAIREGRTLRRLPRYIDFNEELAWVVGFYTAEGSTSSKQVMFGMHREETEELAKLNAFFSKFGTKPCVQVRSKNGIQVYYSSTVAAQLLQSLCPGVATTKRAHELYMYAEPPIAAAFLSGLFAGDGCKHNDGASNKWSFCTVSDQLAADVRFLVLSLRVMVGAYKGKPGTYNIEGRTGATKGPWILSIFSGSKDRLADIFSGKQPEEYGWSRIGVFTENHVWHRVEEVTSVEQPEVIGIQTDQTYNSVKVEGDVETHGTFCMWGAASANSSYIPILPLPIGVQSVGGEARSLLLTGEIQQLNDDLVIGMGFPLEFVKGGTSWAGTNVSIRMVENMFLGYAQDQLAYARWVIREIGNYLEWPLPTVRFKTFRMVDDLQRKAFMLQVNQAGKMSDTSLMAELDYDQETENELMISETKNRLEATKRQQIAMADIQGEAQTIMMKWQAKAQQTQQQAMAAPAAPGEPGGPEGQALGADQQVEQTQEMPQEAAAPSGQMQGGFAQSPVSQQNVMPQNTMNVDIGSLAAAQAKMLENLPKDQQEMALQNLAAQSPELADMVRQILASKQQQQNVVDMRPMPNVLPPRRAAAV